MEKEIPKIDLPEEWIVGTDISRDLLGLYTNYPVRLKCEMFVFCKGGEVEASVNLNRIRVTADNAVLLTPGSIIQIHRVEGDFKVYVVGFSEKYIESSNRSQHILDAMHLALGHPVIALRKEGAEILEEYFKLLLRLYATLDVKVRKRITPNLFANIHMGVDMLYREGECLVAGASKNEQLCRSFTQLVMRNYSQMRNVNWYAGQLNITHAHLCSTVKRITGHTCMEIISSMVIMDAKSQLKQTELSVQEIADALNFANVSFFGKYFKRYVGMSPLEYRNGG